MELDEPAIKEETPAAVLTELTKGRSNTTWLRLVLALKLHESKACTVGNNQILGFVCIDVPPHGQYIALHKRKFFGDYKLTQEDALESANLAALEYLQTEGIISVDDINLVGLIKCEAELAECQHKLLAASSWATIFQERAETLKAELVAAHNNNKKLVNAAKAFDIKKEIPASTLPPFNNQVGASSMLCEKQHAFRGSSVKRALSKAFSANDYEARNIKQEKNTT